VNGLFWASLILAPAAFVVYVPFATYLFVVVTGRSPRPYWIRSIAGDSIGRIRRTAGGTVMAILFATLSQAAASCLVLGGLQEGPFSPLALAAGIGEWAMAIAWLVFLHFASAPTGDQSS
jgi:hypothetical protein